MGSGTRILGCRCRVVLGLTALAVLAAPAASSASTIVWSRNDKNFTRQQIVAARPDGSGLHAISNPPKGGLDIDAQISPNGRRVVFERDFVRREHPAGDPPRHTSAARTGDASTSAASTPACWTPPRPGSEAAGGSPTPR